MKKIRYVGSGSGIEIDGVGLITRDGAELPDEIADEILSKYPAILAAESEQDAREEKRRRR